MNITFEAGEDVVLKKHKHWFVFAMESVMFFILAVLPLIVLALFRGASVASAHVGDSSPALFFTGLWYLALWIFFFVRWTDYYLDIFILTNKRVIYVSQKGLFSRRISSSRLDRVQDVSAEVSGMMPTFLNYGNVQVQTASEEKEFVLHNLPDPDFVKNKILAQYGAAVRAPAEVFISEKGR